MTEITRIKNNKINEIWDLMKEELVTIDEDKEFPLPILTTYVKNTSEINWGPVFGKKP